MNIWEIRDEMGLKRHTDEIPYYDGVYTTGSFDNCFDYDAGLLTVRISVSCSSILGKHGVMFSITTVDDGGWQAWHVEEFSKEEAVAKMDEVAKCFKDHMGRSLKLPTEAELNKWLMDVKMWGEFTG